MDATTIVVKMNELVAKGKSKEEFMMGEFSSCMYDEVLDLEHFSIEKIAMHIAKHVRDSFEESPGLRFHINNPEFEKTILKQKVAACELLIMATCSDLGDAMIKIGQDLHPELVIFLERVLVKAGGKLE